MNTANPQFDERDAAILKERMAALDLIAGPRVGDFVRFADGVELRISYVWDNSFQTSRDGDGWYLSMGHLSFSGTLFPSVPLKDLTRTEETREGRIWFFHHGYAAAHCGVWATAAFRLYTHPGNNPGWDSP